MKEIPLYNLDLGLDAANTAPFEVGPFQIKLSDDYADAVTKIPRQEQVRKDMGADGNLTTVITPEVPGAWTITAEALLIENTSELSILAHEEIPDNGRWDLCEILTFLTGRRVLCDEHLDRDRRGQYRYLGGPVLETAEYSECTNIAWLNRKEFEDRDLGYALFAYNESLSQGSMHLIGYLQFLSLEVLVRSHSHGNPLAIPKKKKAELRAKIVERLTTAGKELELSEAQIEAMTGALGNTVMQGPGTAVSHLTDLLVHLGVVSKSLNEHEKLRVQYLNRVRNFFVHTGAIPDFKNLPELMSLNLTGAIVVGIVPNICRLAIAEALGYRVEEFRKLRQYKCELMQFFAGGTWRNWNLSDDFDRWFYGVPADPADCPE